MAGDIFISQGITLSFQVVNNFVSPQLHQGILLSGVLTQRHACPPHHLPQGGPRTEKECGHTCYPKVFHQEVTLDTPAPTLLTKTGHVAMPKFKGKVLSPREAWHAAVHAKSCKRTELLRVQSLSDRTELNYPTRYLEGGEPNCR